MMKVKISQGNKPVEHETKEVKSDTTKQPANMVSSKEKPEDIVTWCKDSIKAGSISYTVASECIVAQIRAIYFNSIVKPDGYDLETLCYLDKILFNTLTSIITGIIAYGSGTIHRNLVCQTIENTISAIEHQVDKDAIEHIIDRVYEEF